MDHGPHAAHCHLFLEIVLQKTALPRCLHIAWSCLALQWQSWVFETDHVWPAKPKIFTLRPFTRKVCQSQTRAVKPLLTDHRKFCNDHTLRPRKHSHACFQCVLQLMPIFFFPLLTWYGLWELGEFFFFLKWEKFDSQLGHFGLESSPQFNKLSDLKWLSQSSVSFYTWNPSPIPFLEGVFATVITPFKNRTHWLSHGSVAQNFKQALIGLSI